LPNGFGIPAGGLEWSLILRIRKEEQGMSREKSQARKIIDLAVTMVISLLGISAYSAGDTMVVRFLNIPIPAWLFVPLAIIALIAETNSLISGAEGTVLLFLGLPAVFISSLLVAWLAITLLMFWVPRQMESLLPDPLLLRSIGWVLVGGILFVKTWLPNYRKPAVLDSVDSTPTEAQQHLKQAYDYEEKDDFENALRECELAIQLDPDWAEPHNLRGILLEELGRKEEAIAAYRQATRLDPAFHDAFTNLLEATTEARAAPVAPDQASPDVNRGAQGSEGDPGQEGPSANTPRE
jgi:hypothetical protein